MAETGQRSCRHVVAVSQMVPHAAKVVPDRRPRQLRDFKLGFVSRGENKELSKFCEMGYADIFDVRINRLSPDEHPENQVGVIVYIDRKAD